MKWFNATTRSIVSRKNLKCLKKGLQMRLEEPSSVSLTLKEAVREAMEVYMEIQQK